MPAQARGQAMARYGRSLSTSMSSCSMSRRASGALAGGADASTLTRNGVL